MMSLIVQKPTLEEVAQWTHDKPPHTTSTIWDPENENVAKRLCQCKGRKKLYRGVTQE